MTWGIDKRKNFRFYDYTNLNLSVTPFFIRIFQIYIVPEPFLQVM